MRLKTPSLIKSKNNTSNLLRVTLLAGLFLLILSGAVLTVFYLFERNASKLSRQQDSFYRILHEYDISISIFVGTEKEYEKLNDELDKLEKRVIGVESWLSVLKRRRELAARYPPSRPAYNAASLRALEAYPQSQPIAALAAAAAVKDSALNSETQEKLRSLLPLLTDQSFNTLRLSLHVLLGDFHNVQTAQRLSDNLFSDGTEDISIDLAILKTLKSDYPAAAAEIQALVSSWRSPSKNSLRFAAEFHYDFGDLRRSAELFSIINDEQALLRAADALYLAGYTGSARSIWLLLSNVQNKNSLYNLAVTTDDSREKVSFLERLVNTVLKEDESTQRGSLQAQDNAMQFGLIRYSRLLEYPQSVTLLEEGTLKPSGFPFLDLEICKQNSRVRERARQLADAWLLLDRHPENEDLYHWAAWLMFFQRFPDEADILLRRAEQFQFSEKWPPVYRALYLMESGELDEAEELLRSADGELWHIYANLGRILETQFSFSAALSQYERAAEITNDTKAASRINFRMAKCYAALGRPLEMQDALVRASELDPNNHSARLELDRTLGASRRN